jgi:HAMP domain-containing protein
MRLLLKFNLAFIVIFVIALAATGALTRKMLERNAQDEVLQQARFLFDKALAVRSYTSTQVAPLLETQMKYSFLPQSVPAFAATEVLAKVQKSHAEYSYKEATLNPTNPRDRAVDWEADLIGEFRKTAADARDRTQPTGTRRLPAEAVEPSSNTTLPQEHPKDAALRRPSPAGIEESGRATFPQEFIGQRDTPAGRALYIARPIRITDGACLRCHSTIDAAPRTLVDKYGTGNGFGWQLNEVVGAQIVSVPMAVPLTRAHEAWALFMSLLSAVFATIAVVLNAMLWWLVIRPVTRLARIADRVSLGEMSAPAFKLGAHDEIGRLAVSFTRMRKSMVQALRLLGSEATTA